MNKSFKNFILTICLIALICFDIFLWYGYLVSGSGLDICIAMTISTIFYVIQFIFEINDG